MSDSTGGPYELDAQAPSMDGPAGTSANQTQPTTAIGTEPPPTAPSRPPDNFIRRHPVETIIGALAALAVVLGAVSLGLVLSRTGGTSANSTSSNIQQQTISVISDVDPSVVQIQARGRSGGGVGSGEILTASGYIVTNSHVVHGATSFTVLLAGGQSVAAQLVADVPEQDLAVLKISASGLKPIAVADSGTVPVGEYAIAMGSPLGLEQSATTGIVSALNREGTEVVDGKRYTLTGMLQTSAPINPGNSGGALVNSKGQLIGIPTLSAVEPSTQVAANGIGFAISSNTMQQVIKPYVPTGG